MQQHRILYFSPDSTYPAGGMRTIYSHVEHLVRNGFSAFVVHCQPGFRPAWFTGDVPTLYFQTGLPLNPGDLLVVPEDMEIIFDALKSLSVKKAIFCQNHFYMFNSLPPGRSWRDYGISRVFACSDVIADFIRSNLGWSDVPVVHCAIDHRLFAPRAKKMQIAFMPRKFAVHARFIRGLCAAMDGPVKDIRWVEIKGVPEQRVAEILSESAIFLSLSQLEGFGLPPLEAMACGCAVVGYHGYGGLEYATRDNGFWCEEGNPMECARVLRQVVEMAVDDPARLQPVIEAAMRTAARYNAERQEKELVQLMRRFLDEE